MKGGMMENGRIAMDARNGCRQGLDGRIKGGGSGGSGGSGGIFLCCEESETEGPSEGQKRNKKKYRKERKRERERDGETIVVKQKEREKVKMHIKSPYIQHHW